MFQTVVLRLSIQTVDKYNFCRRASVSDRSPTVVYSDNGKATGSGVVLFQTVVLRLSIQTLILQYIVFKEQFPAKFRTLRSFSSVNRLSTEVLNRLDDVGITFINIMIFLLSDNFIFR